MWLLPLSVEAEISIKIQGNIYDTALKQNIGSYVQSGDLKSMFKVQKQVVRDVFDKIGVDINSLSPDTIKAINEIPTNSFEAFKEFSVGLNHLDEGDFEKASASFANATKIDPNFGLAKTLSKTTPKSNQSIGQLIGKALGQAKAAANKDINSADSASNGNQVNVDSQSEEKNAAQPEVDSEGEPEDKGQSGVAVGEEGEPEEKGQGLERQSGAGDEESETEAQGTDNNRGANVEGDVEGGDAGAPGDAAEVDAEAIEDLELPEQPKSSVQSVCP